VSFIPRFAVSLPPEDAPEPVPDWDCFGQPEADFELDQRVAG
jgi:hypothetical protein